MIKRRYSAKRRGSRLRPSRLRSVASARAALQGELLEFRRFLAGDVTASIDAARNLQIAGSTFDDQIFAIVDAAKQSITVSDAQNQVGSFPLNSFDKIIVRMGDGNDFYNQVDANATIDSKRIVLDIDAGNGDNTVLLTQELANPTNYAVLRAVSGSLEKFKSIMSDMEDTSVSALKKGVLESIADVRNRLVYPLVGCDAAQPGVPCTTANLEKEVETKLFPTVESLHRLSEEQFSAPLNEFMQQMESLASEAEAFLEESGTRLTEIEGPDEEADANPADEGLSYQIIADDIEARAAKLESQIQGLTESAQERFANFGQRMEQDLTNLIGLPAEDLLRRANEIVESAETHFQDAENSLATIESSLQLRAKQVQDMLASITSAFAPITQQLQNGQAMAAKVPGSSAHCNVTPVHTFAGGSGTDIFFPFSSPTQSWLINGNAGNDVLLGGFADDEINGGAGMDLIFGLKGNDILHGNNDTDFLFGEFLIELPSMTGDDCIYGDAGIDLLVGDNGLDLSSLLVPGGADDMHGGDDQDLLVGDDITDIISPALGGADTMFGDDAFDVLFGTSGNDTIEGGKYIDVMFGNDGDDTLYAMDNTYTGDGYTIPSTTIVLGSIQFGNKGEDKIFGANGVDLQFGNRGKDEIYGKDYVDVQFGGPDADKMYGESGGVLFTISSVPIRFGNVMFGGTEDDQMWGGGDFDVMLGNDGMDTMYGYDGNFVPLGIETDVMLGGIGNDVMEGDDESLLLWNSNDWMFGQAGDDTMRGGSQNDKMFGGPGVDTMSGDSNGALLINSKDLMFGESGNDVMDGGNSIDVMLGGADDDKMQGDNESWWLATSIDVMFGNAGDDRMDGGANPDLMSGNLGDDYMMGDNGASWMLLSLDIMLGNDGCDEMYGGRGIDIMRGNDGHDYMDGQWGADLMFGNKGTDTMNGGDMPDIMSGGDDNDLLHGNDGQDIMTGGDGDDCLWGDSHIDIVLGNNGNDCIHGGNGNDWLFGRDNNDLIFGDAGRDRIFGNDGDDNLEGNGDRDWMWGNGGNDQMWGGPSKDFMWGNSGNDTLWGGSSGAFMWGGTGSDSVNSGGPDTSGLQCTCVLKPCKFDFGDAPNPYGTLLPTGAQHGVQGPRLGTLIDAESDGQPTANADGDDINGIDDEDGVNITTLTVGTTQPVTVVLSNAPTARLDAWVDFNSNGAFDPSEQVATNLLIASGANTVNITTPLTAALGTSKARFRVSSTGGLGPTGYANDGEVEDYTLTIVPRERDFGDAPTSYSTLLINNGPSHDLGGPRLGLLIDAEANGNPSPNAIGDDFTASDDEDGVILNPLIPGFSTAVTVTLSNAVTARLNAWVDFNGNGVFDHPAEQVFNSVALLPGPNLLSFPVPSTSVFNTFARFRVTPNGFPSPVGYGGPGEVEDYRVVGETQVHDFGDAPDSYQTTVGAGGPFHALGGPQLGTLIDFDGNGQPSLLANGDDLTNTDDEDGVVLTALTPGSSTKVNVFLSNAVTAKVDAWIDFNLNGIFDHPSERILNAATVSTGANSLGFAVPLTAVVGTTYARFRVSAAGGLTPAGFGGLGEVEDYTVTIQPGATNLSVFDASSPTMAAMIQNFRSFRSLNDPGVIRKTIFFEGLQGAVDPNAFAADYGVRFRNAAGASYGVEGTTSNGLSVEELDGFDGSFAPDKSTILVKLNNHQDGFTIVFDPPVSAAASFVGTGKEGDVSTLTVEAFDVNGNLLNRHKTKVAPHADPRNREGFWAIQATEAVIGSIRIKNDNTTDFGNALLLGHLSFDRLPDARCDVNGDGDVNLGDIDQMQAMIRFENPSLRMDLNQDGKVNASDLDQLLNGCLRTPLGDVNLDGSFNTTDFVLVFQAGFYETGLAATYAQGDWNSDGLFNSADFVEVFRTSCFCETGPRAALIPIQDPTSPNSSHDVASLRVAAPTANRESTASAIDYLFASDEDELLDDLTNEIFGAFAVL